MSYKKIDPNYIKKLKAILQKYPPVEDVVSQINKPGGKALLVGGAVRDLLLGLPVKDLDIEVHGINAKKLEEILKKFGTVSTVGKAFGVLRLHGLDVDWSLPRTDASGRKPKVTVDPFMSFAQAFRRRDLTINAMGIDLATYELIDPFDGFDDLQKGILRAPDEKLFIEDPLRFYRVMQFIARFGMKPDKKLNEICARMDIAGVSRERVEQECKKWLLKSEKPSLALDWLKKIGRLQEILPEVAALQKVPQRPDWHPEGDVYEHAKQAIDAAAQLEYADENEKLVLMYAALCHDLGKATTTEKRNGIWISYGHAEAGVPLAKKMLKRITNNKELIDSVCTLVQYHLLPSLFITSKAKAPAYKRLAKKIAPLTLKQLALLSLADKRARNPKKGKPLTKKIPEVDTFLKNAQKAKVLETVEQPVLHGKDLLDVIKPGPEMGMALEHAYKLQIERGIKDKDQLKKLVLQNYKK